MMRAPPLLRPKRQQRTPKLAKSFRGKHLPSLLGSSSNSSSSNNNSRLWSFHKSSSQATTAAGPIQLIVAACAAIACLWTAGAGLVWVSQRLGIILWTHHRQQQQQLVRQPLDLWPDDALLAVLRSNNTLFASSCQAEECQLKEDSNTVVIATPPGRFGTVLSEYVQALINGGNWKVVVFASNPGKDWMTHLTAAAIIRIAIFPPVLAAVDACVAANPRDNNNRIASSSITFRHLHDSLQHGLEWHCHIDKHVQKRANLLASSPSSPLPPPVYTVTAQELLAYPQMVREGVQEFLQLPTQQEQDTIRTPWAQRALTEIQSLVTLTMSSSMEKQSARLDRIVAEYKCPVASV